MVSYYCFISINRDDDRHEESIPVEKSYVSQTGWRLSSQPNYVLSKTVKAKYFPNSSPFDGKLKP